MRVRHRVAAAAAAAWMFAVHPAAASAQTPAPAAAAVKALSGSTGFGLSLTQGNSDTLNLSVTADAAWDPKTKNVMKGNVLFLRGSQNGVVSVNRVSGMFRDEFTMSPRTFVFGQIDLLHDTFKGIDYLAAPTVGVGYKAIGSMSTQLTLDAGAGGVVERDAGAPAHAGGAITLDEKLTRQITGTTTVKEAVAALLKTGDFADGLYTFQAGLAVKINAHLQLSVDFLDTFKNRPLDPALERNDIALVTSVVAKY